MTKDLTVTREQRKKKVTIDGALRDHILETGFGIHHAVKIKTRSNTGQEGKFKTEKLTNSIS
jgi:hypothetical protein